MSVPPRAGCACSAALLRVAMLVALQMLVATVAVEGKGTSLQDGDYAQVSYAVYQASDAKKDRSVDLKS